VLAKPQPPEAHPTEWFNQNKFNQANTTGTSLTVGTAIAGTSAYNAALLMTR
jgi:hydroxymethylpyrimidine/phosphomethylpyrimidine kinase